MPVVMGMLQCIKSIMAKLKLLIFLRGQIDDQHRRPAIEQRNQADRAAGQHVGDEQFFAVDDERIAVANRAGSQRRQIGAGAGSVRANAERLWPLASRGRNRCFCSALPNVRTGSTAPMQP